jgi:hypothetical protein
MAGQGWPPVPAVGVALAAAAITGLVMAIVLAGGTMTEERRDEDVPWSRRAPVGAAAEGPTARDIEACNQYAEALALLGGAAGVRRAAVKAAGAVPRGLDERRAAAAGYVDAYRACMKGRGYGA